MENAITYKDLYLSFGEVISMDKLEIVQRPGQHGTLQLSAVLDGEREGEVFDELPENVSVLYREDGEEKILFKGMVVESSMERVGNHRKLELKAYDATYLLDKKRKTRSFQNTSRTNHSVIDEVMKEYPGSICIKNLPNEPIGRIWVQYEETDWEFLRRFLSNYSDSLYADATYHTARFQAGLSPEDIQTDWENAPYSMGKDLERYDYLSQNGLDVSGPEAFVEYAVNSYSLYTLGSRLLYKGRQWYVGELTRKLTDGLLTTTYHLKTKEALLIPKMYNHRITGISMDGKTTQVESDKVRVVMNDDMTTEQGTYWFPFSTMAASADGSGWYSMPEVADSIRVYFPTCDEKEGYVITKHDSHMPASDKTSGGQSKAGAAGVSRSSASSSYSGGGSSSSSYSGGDSSSGSHSGGGSSSGSHSGGGSSSGDNGHNESYDSSGSGGSSGGSVSGGGAMAGAAAVKKEEKKEPEKKKKDPMDDPDNRNIFTKDGCTVQLVSEGVILSAGEDGASLILKKFGGVIFDAPNGVYIHAGEKLIMSADRLTINAGNMIDIRDKAGSDIVIGGNFIKLHGKEIFEN